MVTTTSLWLLTLLFAVHLASAADVMDDDGDVRNATSPAMRTTLERLHGSTCQVTEMSWNVQGIGELIRAMQDVKLRRKEAYSKPFVLNGYTVHMSLHIWRSLSGIVWLQLHFGPCKGPDDDFLAWPFRTPYTLTLLHPTRPELDNSRVFDTFSNTTFVVYERPKKGCNRMRAIQQLITVSEAEKRGYIVDDAVSVHVELNL